MKKALMVIGGFVVGIIILFASVFFITSITSEKLVCKSNQGSITIMYNDKTIKGYTAKGLAYDLDGQKKIAEEIGIDTYISQFNEWFTSSTNGTCK